MHLKFYRDQKLAAQERMKGREETFDVNNEDDWDDFLSANGKIRPCKTQRLWDKFVVNSWLLGIAIFFLYLYL